MITTKEKKEIPEKAVAKDSILFGASLEGIESKVEDHKINPSLISKLRKVSLDVIHLSFLCGFGN